MQGKGKVIVYNAFGLNILSDIALPELPQRSGQKVKIDINIRLADLTGKWEDMADFHYRNMVICENLYMFRLRDVALFCIDDGNEIIVSPDYGADFDKIRLFILGTCMGALLMQRKILPLHGSSIVIDGKAYAFIGERGAGKSTIAAAFIRKGYEILTDDVIAIKTEESLAFVIPSYPHQKLWQESIEAFGEATDRFKPLYDRETKYSVPVKDNYYSMPIQLGGIFELVKTDDDFIKINCFGRLEQLKTLYVHTFRQFLLKGFGLLEWHFNTTSNIVKFVNLYQLQRPTEIFTVEELVSLVLETIKKGETANDRNQKTLIGQ